MSKSIIKSYDDALIVGIDIAKHIHWAQLTDNCGNKLCKPIKITNDLDGFQTFTAILQEYYLKLNCKSIFIGFEPSGHYWRAIAWYLKSLDGITIVGVNPYHVKQLKELEDNTQTKNDQKDALVIAHLIRDGRYFDIYFPKEQYAELRVLRTHREQLTLAKKRLLNNIIALMDEYFPEYESFGFKYDTISSELILRTTPFPSDILQYSSSELQEVWKNQNRKAYSRIGKIFTEKIIYYASRSIGITEGIDGVRIRLNMILDQLNLLITQLKDCDTIMTNIMESLEINELLTSVPGVGNVTAASFIAETGDLSRFDDWKQIRKLAGLNLVEQSSGQHKGQTKISKRGRPGLRKVIYQIGDKGMLVSAEMMSYYQYLRHRQSNQLKHDQAVLAVGIKLMRIMFHTVKYNDYYDSCKALGDVRIKQIKSLA